MMFRRSKVSSGLQVLVVLSLLSITGCPNNLTRELYLQVGDNTSPVVHIDSPEDGSSYAATVVIAGTVQDLSDALDGEDNTGGIDTLTYSFSPAFIPEGTVVPAEDGNFEFQFETDQFTGPVLLTVAATDWNANIHTASIALKDEGAIPTFSASPGPSQVELSWDPVPLSSSYTLYYTSNGAYPSEGYGSVLEDITSPCVLSDLANGNEHIFQLRSASSSGKDNYSEYVSAIPLSGTTVIPEATGAYRRIDLNWQEIEGAEEYIVLRALDRNGFFINISGPIRRNTFSDTEVIEGEIYYYKVRPSMDNGVDSMAVSCSMSPFPDSVSFQFLASEETEFQTADIRVQGDYIYVAERYGGLGIYDFSDHQTPKILSHYKAEEEVDFYFDEIVALDVLGDYACVSYGEYEPIELLDISDKSNPVMVDRFYDEDWGGVFAIKITDDYIFLIDWSSGLVILDRSDESNLVSICSGFYETTSYGAYEVEVIDEYVIFACRRTDELVIIDITDASNPSVVSTYTLSQVGFCGLAVSGDYAYVGDYQVGMHILDISDKTKPTWVSTFNWEDDRMYDIAVSGSMAFLIYVYEGLAVVDISDPANPILMESSTNTYWPLQLDVQDGYAFVADDTEGIKIFYMAALGFPKIVSTYTGLANEAGNILINDEYACIMLKQQRTFLDISSPANPVLLAQRSDWWRDACMSGDQIYSLKVNSYSYSVSGLSIANLTSFDFPDNLGYVIMYGLLQLDAQGDYVYGASTNNGLYIADVSNPENPVMYGQVEGIDANDVKAVNDYAFVAAGTDGLKVIDISNPRYPSVVSSYPPSTVGIDYSRISVSEDHVYIYDALNGLVTVDVTNPLSPQDSGSATMSEIIGEMSIVGNYGVAPGTGGDLHMLSLADPSNPEVIGTCTDVNASVVEARGKYAYTYGDGVFKIVDLMP